MQTQSIVILEDGPSSPRSTAAQIYNLQTAKDKRTLDERLQSSKRSYSDLQKLNRKQKDFYEKQNDLIDDLLNPIQEKADEEEEARKDYKIKIALRASMAANLLLFAMQLTGSIWSHSLSLISTTIDAFMDNLSNAILWITDHYRRKKNPALFPAGKSRMEPIGIILFSSLMAFMSLQLMRESIGALINKDTSTNVTVLPIVLVSIGIVLKIGLWIYCRALTYSSTARTLATDHFNDIIINVFGLAMAILGHHVKWWIDPTGALIIALLILRSWGFNAYEQIQLLVGKTASREFLHKLTYVAMNHHPLIKGVDTCRAFHVGENTYVELDIVLPEDMPLKQSHDIGESLQLKLEEITGVERAFVHCDYETDHRAEDEHKHPQ